MHGVGRGAWESGEWLGHFVYRTDVSGSSFP